MELNENVKKEVKNQGPDIFPEVESAIEISNDMVHPQQIRDQQENLGFLRRKKPRKEHKTLWYGLYDFFMCTRCTENPKK